MADAASAAFLRDPQALIEKLKNLPPERVAEVEDFVDFLRTRNEEERNAAAERLGEAMTRLAAVDFPPMSEEQVQAEIDAARRERHGPSRHQPYGCRRP